MPNITVNAEPKSFPDPVTVADLLRHLGKDAKKLAVEVNRNVVPRGEHAACRLKEGDAVEIVTLVGGGSGAGQGEKETRGQGDGAASSPCPRVPVSPGLFSPTMRSGFSSRTRRH